MQHETYLIYVDSNCFIKNYLLNVLCACVCVCALHKVMQELCLPAGDSGGMEQKEGLDEAQR